MSAKREGPARPAKSQLAKSKPAKSKLGKSQLEKSQSLGDEVAEALGAERRPRPAADELADRDSGSPGPIADDPKKP